METNHKNAIRNFIIDNFQYDPARDKPVKKTLKQKIKIESFESINFLLNEGITSYFIFHALKILISKETLIKEKKDKVKKLLSHIYSFFEDNFDCKDIIIEIQLPFRFSTKIINCFEKENNNNDFVAFLLFNMALLLNKSLDEKFYQSMNFNLINILYLYEHIFIHSNSKDEIQIIIAKIITILFNNMVSNFKNKINFCRI